MKSPPTSLTVRTVEKTVAGRVQNLKPWPKGVSGNPGGRPKGDVTAEIARAVFENNSEAIYNAMLRALLKGNPRVFAVLADRAYGRVKQQIEVDDGSQAIIERLEAAWRREVRALSDEELQRQLSILEAQLAGNQVLDEPKTHLL
jgi:hypothetical protein